MEHIQVLLLIFVNGTITSINSGTSSGYTVSIAGGGESGVNITCVLSGVTIGTFTGGRS